MATRPSGSARLEPKYNVDAMTIAIGVATGTESSGDKAWQHVLDLDIGSVPEQGEDGKPFFSQLVLESFYTKLSALASGIKDNPEGKAYEMATYHDLWLEGVFAKTVEKLSADDKRLVKALAFHTQESESKSLRTIRGLEAEQRKTLRDKFKELDVFTRMDKAGKGTIDIANLI